MKRIGLIVAVEENAVTATYGKPISKRNRGGMEISHYKVYGKNLFIANCGMGSIAASAATELLIAVYKAEAILNFGVVGALRSNWGAGKAAIVEYLVDVDYDISGIDGLPRGQHEGHDSIRLPLDKRLIALAEKIYPNLPKAVLASGDTFVIGKKKEEIAEKFGCDLVDMELSGIAYTAERSNVPVFSIKAVADALLGGGEDYYANKEEAALNCFKLLDEMVKKI